MTAFTPNLPLLRKVIDHITAHPDEHGQDQWAVAYLPEYASQYRRAVPACGTALCVAGHAAVMSGHTLAFTDSADKLDRDVYGAPVMIAARTGTGRAVMAVAREELGLTNDEAADLFDGRNDLADIKRIAGEIAARAGEEL